MSKTAEQIPEAGPEPEQTTPAHSMADLSLDLRSISNSVDSSGVSTSPSQDSPAETPQDAKPVPRTPREPPPDLINSNDGDSPLPVDISLEMLRLEFEAWDSGRGYVKKHGIKKIFGALDIRVSEQAFSDALQIMDVNHDGRYTIDVVWSWWNDHGKEQHLGAEMKNALTKGFANLSKMIEQSVFGILEEDEDLYVSQHLRLRSLTSHLSRRHADMF